MVILEEKKEAVFQENQEKQEDKGKSKKEKKWLKYLWHFALIVAILAQLFFAMKYFEAGEENLIIEDPWTWETIAIWFSIYLIIKGITNKTKLSLTILIGLETIFDIINYIVRTVRGSTITVSDMFAIRTALSVSKNMHLEFDAKFYIGMLFVILIIATLVIFRRKFIEQKSKWFIRVLKILIGVIAIISFAIAFKDHSLWDMNHNYRWKGTPVTLIRSFTSLNTIPPSGYDKEEAKNILESYEESKTINKDDLPNIIVIINESFCDYYNLYKDGFSDSIEYFTKLSKEENVVSGVMYSSSFGGETANVEYEFLTQNSLRILPVGSYVFQQYISDPVKASLVQVLKNSGYKTSAIHPWESYAYSRNKIYELFDFDAIKFKDDIEGLEKNFNNEFYSDRSTYNEMLKQINQKSQNERIFEYVLTVQNHTGYWNTDPKQIKYNNDNSKNVYMQLIHESADALKYVIDELKEKEEKYILLFFGDHQPNLDGSKNSTNRPIEHYETPFLIWANYDIEEKYNIRTSTVYLQNYLLKAAGIQYSSMNNYMERLQKYYPIITKNFYIDNLGNIHREEDTDKLEEYNKLVYYRIFDN
ncbi:MAG: sulfatase-like hydrolase/transferase [Clostridia bacterium]|nr:sulfatase-like hydrolase/transferase [Clostridia bacterium]